MLYENGIDAFREEKRKEALQRFDQKKQMQAEQAAAIEAERAAQEKPEHERMQELAAATIESLKELQSGDIHAPEQVKRATMNALTIMQYILTITAPKSRKRQQEGAE